MMLGLRVAKKNAENMRKWLVERGLLVRGYKPIVLPDSIIFPIAKEITPPHGVIVDVVFEKIEEKPRSLEEALAKEGIYSKGLLSSFDIIGDIAIVEIPKELEAYEKIIGKAIMEVHKNVKAVFKKASAMEGKFRVRKLKHIAGEKRTETLYKENGVRMKLDVAKVYFSPRLAYERMRIAKQVKAGERILALFAGVGPFPLVIMKKQPDVEIVAVELNKDAVAYMRENAKLNGMEFRIIEGDVAEVLKSKEFKDWADRTIMPLPKDAEYFLPLAFRSTRDGGIIHFYTFVPLPHPGENAEKKVERYIPRECFEILGRRIVRPYSKDVVQVVLDIRVKKKSERCKNLADRNK